MLDRPFTQTFDRRQSVRDGQRFRWRRQRVIGPTMQQRIDPRCGNDLLLVQLDLPLFLLSQFYIGLQHVLLRHLIGLVLRTSHVAKLSQRLAAVNSRSRWLR